MQTESDTLPAAELPSYPQARGWKSQGCTISEASRLYEAEGNAAVYPAYRALVSEVVKSGRKLRFKNDSYLDALYLTDLMFHRAEKSIRLLSGPQADGFLAVLQSSFEGALQKIQINGGTVKVILLHRQAPDLFRSLKERFACVFDFALAEANGEVRHFITCDSKLARIEEPHAPLTPDTSADAVQATVYFNEPEQTKVLENQFDYIWTLLRPPQSGK